MGKEVRERAKKGEGEGRMGWDVGEMIRKRPREGEGERLGEGEGQCTVKMSSLLRCLHFCLLPSFPLSLSTCLSVFCLRVVREKGRGGESEGMDKIQRERAKEVDRGKRRQTNARERER